MPTSADLSESFKRLQIWNRGGERAPHKPLLLLSMLARVQRGEDRLVLYEELHPKLANLLTDFGPSRPRHHPEYPFWRLLNDAGSFWDVPEQKEAEEAIADRPRQEDIPPAILKELEVRGGFTEDVQQLLRDAPELVDRLGLELLQDHFAPSLHESILHAVGMTLDAAVSVRQMATSTSSRSPHFREELMRLYESKCAVCRFDGQLGNVNLALDAAHIRWHAQEGPEDSTNGLLLCSLHHRALDRGAIGITEDRKIMVSQHARGGPRFEDFFMRFWNESLLEPLDSNCRPESAHIEWHTKQVFREPNREFRLVDESKDSTSAMTM